MTWIAGKCQVGSSRHQEADQRRSGEAECSRDRGRQERRHCQQWLRLWHRAGHWQDQSQDPGHQHLQTPASVPSHRAETVSSVRLWLSWSLVRETGATLHSRGVSSLPQHHLIRVQSSRGGVQQEGRGQEEGAQPLLQQVSSHIPHQWSQAREILFSFYQS